MIQRPCADQDHPHHLRQLLDHVGVAFGRPVQRGGAHRERQPGDRLRGQRRFVQGHAVGLGEADQVDPQFVLEEPQFAVDRALERVGADRAFAQQHVQQAVVGA